MIYSHSNNFLFCHVPKTGGTSLRSKLKHYSSPYEQSYINKLIRRLPYFENYSLFYDFYNRPHTTCRKAQLLLGSKYDNLLSFAVIRNPFDWVISSYSHFLKNYKYICIDSIHININSFEQYIDIMSTVTYSQLPCQHKLVVDHEGCLIVDILGEFDKISQFSCFIQKVLKLDRFDLPHLNKNLRLKQNLINMNTTVKNKIKTIWESDFHLWDVYQVNKENFFYLVEKHSIAAPDLHLDTYDPWSIFMN